MSALAPHAHGVTLAIKAKPGAKKNGLLGMESGMLKVSVTAPPEDGRANEALIDLLRETLHVKRSQIELLRGATHRQKVFLIRDVTVAEIAGRLAQIG